MNTKNGQPIANRLLHHVTKQANGCWEWTSNIGTTRTASLNVGGKLIKTSRLSYETWVGPIPEGLVVRHKCDNGPCINPEHLELGTMADNSRDMVERGRSARREGHSQAKLTWEKVRLIREKYRAGLATQETLGEEFGVSRRCIGKVVNNDTWQEEENNN